jgi:GAF domain-containing protein
MICRNSGGISGSEFKLSRQIVSWLMVPVLYQGRVLGMVEMHQCRSTSAWEEDELALVEAIATQLGAALIQVRSQTI